MKATVNGQPRDLPDGCTIAALLDALDTVRGVAVARNDRVVPRAQHESCPIADGDRIEIIRAVAGG
ncbi:MAG: sulfur carrier protein ThiS [Candidatus Eremiobacteraeota bacterium]|nr:sulfur carrier protein ThiS [Candidatus Eremiobacteraeota bacterium]MBV8434327.1 sulfur carrier protein ThiS [Candidatus Eremiobacteraeota bacterium]MBV8582587.1 sulfur carrier protein ThiS [Candidatus Eremiobacteraeota bacterium]